MPSAHLEDIFDDPASWMVVASGQAQGTLVREEGPDGRPGLRLDFNFHGSGGFVVARKEIQFALPETFEFALKMRGDGLANNFEFKIADPGGANAWRYLLQEHEFPETWETLKIRERDLPFAWGPAGGGAPSVVSAIELVIAAGPGGSGNVSFSSLSLDDQTLYFPEKVTASSHQPNKDPAGVFEPGSPSGWQAMESDASPWWSVDFGRVIRFGGLVITWPLPMPPRGFEIEISSDGSSWKKIFHARHSTGPCTHIPAPCADARYLRIHFSNAGSAALGQLDLKPDSFSHTPNDFIHAVAKDFPRGWFPRYWHHEQSYWTPVGSPAGRRRALINEEGLVETDEGGFSLEPFLLVSGNLVTWADAEISVSLADGGIPIPTVRWKLEGLTLDIMPWVEGKADDLVLRVTYRITNSSGHEVRLSLAARPFQVNPPWQAFRNLGGVSPIHDICCSTSEMVVEGRRVIPDKLPDRSGVAAFEEDGILHYLEQGATPPRDELHDDSGMASAAMSWDLPLGNEPFEVTLTVPFFERAKLPSPNGRDRELEDWRKILAPVEWKVPSIAQDAIDCFRTAAAHILINRDGPAIQPGPRRYTRSWVRDCVIMGAAMAKADIPHVLRDFLLWYAQFQREDGFIPCVVDRDGIDWLVEHDSHGQFIWGVREVYRSEGEMEFLNTLFPHVRSAADYLIDLRAQSLTDAFLDPERIESFGLLPESASHEGYLAHPVHSYWDDFWGIRGLEAAAELAGSLGLDEEAARWHAEARKFLSDTLKSLARVIARKKIDYIPGSVEWADFDPTATANAIAQLDFADDLPGVPLHRMLETYLEGFSKKHRGEIPWLNYTAYEIRIIGAFVRIGKRKEAHELLDFFLSDQRPVEWNQWPEITWRDPRSPGHLGDVPHTWIAAEYMLAIFSMLANERESPENLVLASGMRWSWISEENGFTVDGLITRFGRLRLRIHANAPARIDLEIGGGLTIPPGGLFVAPPLPDAFRIVSVEGKNGVSLTVEPDGASVRVHQLPVSATLLLGNPTSNFPT
jgi:hypothetical protein